MDDLKEHIIKFLIEHTGLDTITLEIPPDTALGDYAFPCFALARRERENPAAIAARLAKELPSAPFIDHMKATGAYINFFVNKGYLANSILTLVKNSGTTYGKPQGITPIRVMIEYSAPNTNKPMHLGHIRNNMLGDSIRRILSFCGHTVVGVNLINDRGVHICKAMLAYERWGKGDTPDSTNTKGDHFVGDFYVLFAKNAAENPALESEAQEILRKWEAGDTEVRELWKEMREWVLMGFEATYQRMNISFDHVYYESEIYEAGKQMVQEALLKGIARRDDNQNIVIDLEGVGEKVLLRADGTSVYITQDLYLAKKKFEDYHVDTSIYVVGNEQNYHFTVLFAALGKLGYPYGKKSYHLSYGMVNLPEGKMKSREGTVVDADDLMDTMITLAKEEIIKRDDSLHQEEISLRADQIGLGAIRFFILKHDPVRDILYNPKEAISFEGETGPYVQYAHSRISSILAKGKIHTWPSEIHGDRLTTEEEKQLLLLLSRFPSVVDDAARQYRPSSIAHYLLELCQSFNNYYHKHPVLSPDANIQSARITLIMAIRTVLQNGLHLLGMSAPERM